MHLVCSLNGTQDSYWLLATACFVIYFQESCSKVYLEDLERHGQR
jgi:hypothetical protein